MAHTAEPVPTPRYSKIVAAASNIASDQGHQYVGAEHLFLAIIGDRSAVPTQVLARLVDPDQAAAELQKDVAGRSSLLDRIPGLREVLREAGDVHLGVQQ